MESSAGGRDATPRANRYAATRGSSQPNAIRLSDDCDAPGRGSRPAAGRKDPNPHPGTSIAGRHADRRTDAVAAKPPPHQVASSLVLQLHAKAGLLPETSTDQCARDVGPIDFACLVQGGKRL